MKNLIKGLLIFFFCLLSNWVLSQRNGVVNAKAYVQESVAGNIRVDDNGHPMGNGVTMHYFIYVETVVRPLPQFQTATIDGKIYSVEAKEIKEGKTLIGKTKKDQKNVEVKAKPGHLLWQLVINDPAVTEGVKSKSPVLLKGKWKGRIFTYAIASVTQLEQINHP